ncbi:MAG: hypothetical protein S4CHLAM2_08520 [Chlamydiales bacterium]|nr:hypothetical protein [Chlamydiales bacterium]
MTRCKPILYFGLDPSRYDSTQLITHLPLIRTQPFPYEQIASALAFPHTHVLFTSRQAVEYFFGYTEKRDKIYISVGKATAARLLDYGVQATWVAKEECGEGVMTLLEEIDCGPILYPRSAGARPLLPAYVAKKGHAFPLYETVCNEVELPNLESFDRLVFTSPSTVAAFQKLCKSLPPRDQCEAIGPITQNALNKLFTSTMLAKTSLNCEETDG